MNHNAISSSTQLSELVSTLGRHLVTKHNRIARLERKIAKSLQSAADDRATLIRLNTQQDEEDLRIGAKIYAYILQHPETGKGKTFELGTGTAAIRTLNLGALHFRIDEDTTITEIKERFPAEFDKVIKTTYSVRKDELKKNFPELLDQLSTAYAEPSETLTIAPRNTNYYFRRSITQIQAAANKLGLL